MPIFRTREFDNRAPSFLGSLLPVGFPSYFVVHFLPAPGATLSVILKVPDQLDNFDAILLIRPSALHVLQAPRTLSFSPTPLQKLEGPGGWS
ncbi:hypothetical protein K474DRAFT_1656958 [Panus rudis PR-1116 ss-1]|nr:hypothetical protein K474DRAFT_1656958 [Panus rudis PR-1116 ss-1]